MSPWPSGKTHALTPGYAALLQTLKDELVVSLRAEIELLKSRLSASETQREALAKVAFQNLK